MIIGIINIVGAIILSLVSAFFSITGVRTIFSGAVLSATLMGASLEFSKIGATIWLYSWWKKSSKLLKYYLVFAVVVLIVISSIGIFSFLSFAYVGQEASNNILDTKIQRIDASIRRQENDIQRAEEGLKVLDDAVQIYFDYDQATKGLEQREEQKETRDEYNSIIFNAQNEIDRLLDERLLLEQEVETFQINVGPIKYIATLIYGEDDASNNYDNAARIFIIMLVIVFDPFAVLLMVSGNLAIDKSIESKKRKRRRVTKKVQPKKKRTKKQPTKVEKKKELPMEDHKVTVDMSNYLDPAEIKRLKETTEHRRPLPKQNKKLEG